MSAHAIGRSAPYTEGFRFEIAKGGTEDVDESMMAGAMAGQIGAKAKDQLTGKQEPPRTP